MHKFSYIILIICLILTFGNITAQAGASENLPLFKGRVLEVASSSPIEYYGEYWEIQTLTVKLMSGPQKKQVVTVSNTLTGHPYFDLNATKGDRVLLQLDPNDPEVGYQLADFSRSPAILAITALFCLSVVVIGGRQGVKAIISLVIMGFVIVSMILPLILKGFNPILVTVGLSSALTGLFILFIGGYSKKTAAAISGTIGGLVASGLLALIIGKIGYLSGLASEEAQMLQFMDSSINFQGLLFSGMIIGALGAILDVGISISSAMEQIKEADPTTDFQTLFTRGLHVGKDLIATMSNTLILAYVGSSLPLLLLFHTSQSSWKQVLNLDLITTEIVRAMAGSVGLTLAIPITAFVAALLFVEAEDKSQNLSN